MQIGRASSVISAGPRFSRHECGCITRKQSARKARIIIELEPTPSMLLTFKALLLKLIIAGGAGWIILALL